MEIYLVLQLLHKKNGSREGGAKSNVLADFFIGAQAAVLNCPLLTRDERRYRSYYPTVTLITPHNHKN